MSMEWDSQGSKGAGAAAPKVFSAVFLDRLQEVDGPLSAGEAELAGPWRVEAVPGRPGNVAVLRVWESLDAGDVPRAVFLHEDLARLCAVALPMVGREPLFHLEDEPGEDGTSGFPVVAVEGERGPRVCGWLTLFDTQVIAVVHVLQALVRSPAALAEVIELAGSEALAQVDRILGRRLEG